MKRTTRRNIDDLAYSLHDMHVTGLRADGDALDFEFKEGYLKLAPPCVRVAGEIRFNGVDWDFCFAYVLDILSVGDFAGRKWQLADFVAEYRELEFEIIGETYGYNKSRFAGWLHSDADIKECVIEIYHMGAMEYITQE